MDITKIVAILFAGVFLGLIISDDDSFIDKAKVAVSVFVLMIIGYFLFK